MTEVVLLTQDIRESQVRVPKKLWEMGMGGRQDGDGVRCRNMNRRKPGISREVLRQRWRELCSGEMAAFWRKAWFSWVGLSAWKLEPLQPYNYVMGPGPLSTQESKCSWAPDAPTAWPVQGLSSCSCSLPPFSSVHPLLRMPIGDLCSPPFSDFLRLYFP